MSRRRGMTYCLLVGTSMKVRIVIALGMLGESTASVLVDSLTRADRYIHRKMGVAPCGRSRHHQQHRPRWGSTFSDGGIHGYFPCGIRGYHSSCGLAHFSRMVA